MNQMKREPLTEEMIQAMEDQKPFMLNPEKADRVDLTIDLMRDIFPSKKVFTIDHPTRFGTLIIGVTLPHIILDNEDDIEAFSLITGMADTVEYHATKEGITLLCTIYDAYFERHPQKIN